MKKEINIKNLKKKSKSMLEHALVYLARLSGTLDKEILNTQRYLSNTETVPYKIDDSEKKRIDTYELSDGVFFTFPSRVPSKKNENNDHISKGMGIISNEDFFNRCRDSYKSKDFTIGNVNYEKENKEKEELKELINLFGNYILKYKSHLIGQRDERTLKDLIYSVNNPSPGISIGIGYTFGKSKDKQTKK